MPFNSKTKLRDGTMVVVKHKNWSIDPYVAWYNKTDHTFCSKTGFYSRNISHYFVFNK
jgi:hypothetical protein